MPDRKFGRIPSPIDRRDWDLDDFIPIKFKLVLPKKKSWEFPLTPLDQGATAHCVGFSMAHFGINLPTLTPYTKQDAHDFYYKCKVIDGDPKGENGTTLRSAAKVFQNIGAIDNYAFARDLNAIKTWLLTKGPIIMGTLWTEDMMFPDEHGVIDIGGYVLGGHAYLINEWDVKKGYVTILNSWGEKWGIDGRAYISIEDFELVFSYGGEALATIELEEYRTVQNACFLRNLFNRFINWLRN